LNSLYVMNGPLSSIFDQVDQFENLGNQWLNARPNGFHSFGVRWGFRKEPWNNCIVLNSYFAKVLFNSFNAIRGSLSNKFEFMYGEPGNIIVRRFLTKEHHRKICKVSGPNALCKGPKLL